MLDFTVYMHNYYELDNIVIIIIMTDHLNMSMSDIRRNHFHLGGGQLSQFHLVLFINILSLGNFDVITFLCSCLLARLTV